MTIQEELRKRGYKVSDTVIDPHSMTPKIIVAKNGKETSFSLEAAQDLMYVGFDNPIDAVLEMIEESFSMTPDDINKSAFEKFYEQSLEDGTL